MLKHERESEKAKFIEMTIKEKGQHILEYYKWHIIGSIAAFAFIFSLLNIWIFNPPAVPSAQILLSSPYIDEVAKNELQTELQTNLPDLMTENREIMLMPLSMGDPAKDPTAMAMVQKLVAMVAAKEIDLMMGEESTIMTYAKRGYFADYRSILSDEEYKALEEDIVTVDVVIDQEIDDAGKIISEETSAENVLLKVDSSKIEGLFPLGEDVYIGFLGNSQRQEEALEVLNYIIKD